MNELLSETVRESPDGVSKYHKLYHDFKANSLTINHSRSVKCYVIAVCFLFCLSNDAMSTA